MIRLEGCLCRIYCVSVWFPPRGQSHTSFVNREEHRKLELIYSLLSELDLCANAPYTCPPHQWLSSSAAVKHYVYISLSSEVQTAQTVIPSTLQYMIIENPL